MTEDQATDLVVMAVDRLAHCHATGSSSTIACHELRERLRDFATAIRKQCQAEMACTLLTQETEAMGGYDQDYAAFVQAADKLGKCSVCNHTAHPQICTARIPDNGDCIGCACDAMHNG